jgi:hypothetical protein
MTRIVVLIFAVIVLAGCAPAKAEIAINETPAAPVAPQPQVIVIQQPVPAPDNSGQVAAGALMALIAISPFLILIGIFIGRAQRTGTQQIQQALPQVVYISNPPQPQPIENNKVDPLELMTNSEISALGISPLYVRALAAERKARQLNGPR